MTATEQAPVDVVTDKAPEGTAANGAAPVLGGAVRRRRGQEPLPRLHLLLLAVIVAAGLLRGLFWASVTLVFNPIDEQAHFAYVESMATTLRPPVVGRDHLSAEALGLSKRAQTADWRPAPIAANPDDPRWGLVRESYEGVQGPAYYALMALPYKVAHPFGVLTALYALRLASLLLALTAVPIAYLLARELFPRRRDVWLAAPALLVVLQGFNGNLSSVSNDALVVPLAGAVLLAVATARRTGLTTRHAVLTGALLGAGFCTKSQMVALFPLVAVAAVGIASVRRDRLARLFRWGSVAGVSSAIVSLPWLVWNKATYGSFSASDEVDKITGPLQPQYPLSMEGVRRHVASASNSFWDYQLVSHTLGRYMWTLSLSALALVVTAVVVSAVRRRRGEALALAWLGSSWFVTLAMMLLVIYGVFGGKSSVVGRHLYPSLVAVVVAVAAAAFILGGRWAGWAMLLLLANAALTFEQPLVRARIDHDYAQGVIGDLAPVVDQSWGEGLVVPTTVDVTPPCPAQKFAVAFSGAAVAPGTLSIATGAGLVQATASGRQGSSAQYFTVYDLPVPLDGPFTIDLAGVPISASAEDRDPNLVLAGQPGDPVARLFCKIDDAKASRFAQRFTPDHPAFIRYGQVLAWPSGWAWAARLAMVGLLVAYRRHRRRTVPPVDQGDGRPRRAGPAADATADAVRLGAASTSRDEAAVTAPVQAVAAPPTRRRASLVLVAVAYALLLAVWVVTNPPGAAPDEVNHYLRTLAVGRGDVVGRPNPQLADPAVGATLAKTSGADALKASWAARGARLVHVPAGLGPPDSFMCTGFDPTKTARCQAGPQPQPPAAEALTTMGTVEPGPYLLPGLATRAAGSPVSGVLLARAASASLVAVMLVAAAALLWSWAPLALAGFVVAVTPMVVFVGAALSGSGLEVAAAVCFFAALLRVTLGPTGTRSTWAALGASGAALASSRALGPVWILIGVVAVVAAAGVRPAWARLWAGGRWAAGAVAAVVVASGLTAAWETAYQPGLDFDGSWFRHELGPSFGSLQGAGREAIGVFGSLDTHLPTWAYLVWAALVVTLVAMAFVVGTARQVRVLAVLVPLMVLISAAVSAGIMRQNGFGLQGRHVLPVLTVVPLFSGAVVAMNTPALGAFWRRWTLAAVAVPAAGVQGVAWYVNSRRYAVGADGPVVFFGSSEWSPPGGWAVWTVVMASAVTMAMAGAIVACRPPDTR